MREGTSEIDRSIRKILEITEENKRGIEEMARGVREISDSIAGLTELSGRNSSNIATLDAQMRKFKTE
jgi:methyl-accepting chemotaxis protein